MKRMQCFERKRKEGIRFLTALFFCLMTVGPLYASGIKNEVARNDHFTLTFDAASGTLSLSRSDASPFATGVIRAVHSDRGERIIAAPEYSFGRAKTATVSDAVGNGTRVTIQAKDRKKELNAELQITLYDQPQAVVFEVICTNASAANLSIKSIEPIRMMCAEGGALHYADGSKCLLNGAMYYDAGGVHTFGDPYKPGEHFGPIKGGILENNLLSSNKKTVQSWWNLALFSDYGREALTIGYMRNHDALGRMQLLQEDDNCFSVGVESVFDPGYLLKSGQSIGSEKVMILLGADPYTCLEDYAEVVGKGNAARTGSIINGWCDWFYSLDHFSEDEILRNARFAAQYLKPYGLEYIQLDEGYQRHHGDWEGNARFPHGMKWLAAEIKKLGLKPGIWISPFVISETSALFQQHPEWLLKNEDGSLKRIGPWPNEESDWYKNEHPKRYALDITHPGAEQWYTALIDTIANAWGYELIKIDFVAWTLFSADHFYDRSVSTAQAYRRAFEIMRRVAGERCHILDCGPGQITAGLSNSMRIELDQNYGYIGADVWKQYFSGPYSSAGALGKRYYYQNALLTNDIDHVCVDMLPVRQAQAATSLIALSGGNTFSGDRLITLDKQKLEIIKKMYPATGEYVRPVDLLESDPQTTFVASVERPFGTWSVAGFFNPDLKESVTRCFPVERLRLESRKQYLAYDFWEERFAGELTDSIRVNVLPGGMTLLSLHEKQGVPQVVSTTRHVMQGAVELEKVAFDPATSVLSGTSFGPAGSQHSVAVYIPETYAWSAKRGKVYDDYGQFVVKLIEHNIVRIELLFDESGRVEWSVPFDKQ